jgi:dTDP-4-amino-4,6-dideoxygalactose transaminase
MVVTRDEALAERLSWLRALGQRRQNDHVVVGLNSKLHAVQAIVLRHKLARLDDWNARRREIAATYREGLRDCPVGFQEDAPGARHVYHLFQLRTTERDRLLEHLRSAGIDAVVRYPVPVHLQPAFAECGWRAGQFPVAEALARELLCLPIRPSMPDAEIAYVVERVREFFAA